MAFTTTRIDYENSQTVRTPLDTVVMVGDVSRFHTPYNNFFRETSPVTGGYNMIRSDGMPYAVSVDEEFDELCFRRGLDMNHASYSTPGNRARYFLEKDAAWGASVNAQGKYTQTIAFYLGPRNNEGGDDYYSFIFDKIEGPVDYTITLTWKSSGNTYTGTIPAGTHNYYKEFSSLNLWQDGGRVTIELTAQNEGEAFNCVCAGPGIAAMFTPETLISMDMALKTTLDINASGLPASTVDIYAVPESYDGKTAYQQGMKFFQRGGTITVWQGYKEAKTVGTRTYDAEMINRTFYFTEDDDFQLEQDRIHLQARDGVTMLEGKTTGAMILKRNGECFMQGGASSWYYGDEKRGPYCQVSGRYGFLMGALYKAIRCGGDYRYIDCEDISEYVKETINPYFYNPEYYHKCGVYDFEWDPAYYEQYKSLGSWDLRPPEYQLLGYVPDLAPRPFIAWAMNVYALSRAIVRDGTEEDGTNHGLHYRQFSPCYVDAGRPKLTLSKFTSQLTIQESKTTDLHEQRDDCARYVEIYDNYAFTLAGPISDSGLDVIASKSLRRQTGTYEITFLCGSEPISRVICKATKKRDASGGEEATEETTTSIYDLPWAYSRELGRYLYVTSDQEEYRGAIKTQDRQVFKANLQLGDTGYTMLYEWLAERIQKNQDPAEITVPMMRSNDKHAVIDYKSYMSLCGFGEWDTSYGPGTGMTLYREPMSGSFTFRGDPRLQPHDVFTFSRLDGTSTRCTIETLDIHYEKGGTTEQITYREGIV